MYCYYEDKKFKPHNCFTAIFIREKLGKYGENQFKRHSIIAIIGPRMCMASIERLDINDHFVLFFFICPLLTQYNVFPNGNNLQQYRGL